MNLEAYPSMIIGCDSYAAVRKGSLVHGIEQGNLLFS